ncbi:MAG: hypothetical protein CME62_06565 [Halobacteriovoraceae bacterium]|nr:hypothetical protein [Halobacteriovoraceae bacterium]
MKKITFFLLYFSEGAPIGFIWWCLPVLLKDQGFSLAEISTVSSIATIPWIIKFLYAPFVDIISFKFLSLKKQLVIYQLVMGTSLFFLQDALHSESLSFLITILCLHGVFAALQDICIDALVIRSIPNGDLGKMNGILQSGMLVGRSIFGGAGVFIAAKLGVNYLVVFLMLSVFVSLIFLAASKIQETKLPNRTVREYLYDLKAVLARVSFWMLIIITYFAGFSYNGISTIGSALLKELGASAQIHATTYSLFIPISMSLGALIWGRWSDRLPAAKVLIAAIASTAVVSITVGLGLDIKLPLTVLILLYVIFYFFIGGCTASLYSFLMKHTKKEFAALEFSLFMGVVNLCDSNASYLTGQLTESFSYTVNTIILGSISLCALPLLIKCRFTVNKS